MPPLRTAALNYTQLNHDNFLRFMGLQCTYMQIVRSQYPWPRMILWIPTSRHSGCYLLFSVLLLVTDVVSLWSYTARYLSNGNWPMRSCNYWKNIVDCQESTFKWTKYTQDIIWDAYISTWTFKYNVTEIQTHRTNRHITVIKPNVYHQTHAHF